VIEMEQADTEVRTAKEDLYAEIDEGVGVPIRRLVAAKGQQVPRAYAHLVGEDDIETEVAVTEYVDGRATSVRRAAERRPEVSHGEFRDAAAIAEPVDVEELTSRLEYLEGEELDTALEGLTGAEAKALLLAGLREARTDEESDQAAEAEAKRQADEKAAEEAKLADEAAAAKAEEEAKVKADEKRQADEAKAKKAAANKARSGGANKARRSARKK
jgi:hypothetical protein